jgi:hypothetical protein|tara:strand:- start:1157 stop:1753 length:597 start_codon:yes stop_codon:yes gene_type:complete
MDKRIDYNFFHWGPFLYKATLTKEEIKKISSLCSKNNEDYRKQLAGIIKHEHKIDPIALFPTIAPYFQSYLQAYYQHYGTDKNYGNKIELVSSWVNYMTKGESNPLHRHDSDISFVLFTQIPKGLLKEFESHVGNTKPGNINFIYSLNDGKFLLNEHSFFPVVGDLFVFPACLAHYVNPFKCEGERISVSGNIKVTHG